MQVDEQWEVVFGLAKSLKSRTHIPPPPQGWRLCGQQAQAHCNGRAGPEAIPAPAGAT